MKPASVGKFSSDGETLQRYWRFNPAGRTRNPDGKGIGNQLIDLMRESVQRRLGTGDVFVSLSGGYDSRAVAGILADLVEDQERIRSFTYHHGPQVGDTDAGAAAAVASHLGISHQVVEAYRGDVIATISTNAVAGQGIANFCMEADVWNVIGPLMSASDRNLLFVAEIPGMGPVPKGGSPESVLATVSIFPVSTVENFLVFLEPPARDAMRDGWSSYYEQLLQGAESLGDPRAAQDDAYLDQRLSNTLMMWREFFQTPFVRVANPFLDNHVVDFVESLSVEQTSKKRLYRHVLTEAMPDLFSLPISHGGWNTPDWAKELRTNAGRIRDLLQEPSRLDELIPPDAILRLLEAGSTMSVARRDDMNAGLKAMARNSAPFRRAVRALKPRMRPAVRRKRPWDRLLLDLLSLRLFLASSR